MIAREPDLTLVIDMDPAQALERGLGRNSGEDRFEDFGLGFQQALRQGFLALARRAAPRTVLIDGNRTPEVIAAEIAGIFDRATK